MTETSYFWEGIVTGDAVLAPYSTDRYHTNWQVLFTEADNEGVVENYLNELAVAGISGGVIVDSGAALVDGSFYENTAEVTVTIPFPITDPRIDRVVLQKDWGSQTIRIARRAGVENPAPTPPTLTQAAGATWEIPLAQVLITIAGAITVTDERETAETPLAPGGGLLHIETIVSDGSLSQFDFSNIPQTFRHLKLEFVTRHTNNAFSIIFTLRFNGDVGANYNNQFLAGNVAGANASANANLTSTAIALIPALLSDADFAGQGEAHISNYVGSAFKTTISNSFIMGGDALGGFDTAKLNSIWRNTDPIDRISLFGLFDPGGAFVAGSTVSLYGIK